MTCRYEHLEELRGAEGPRRWLPGIAEGHTPPRAHHQAPGGSRAVYSPPPGYRRDNNGALHLTKWTARSYKTDIGLYRLPDGPEEDDMPGPATPATDKVPRKKTSGALINGPGNPFNQKMPQSQPTPDPPKKSTDGKAMKPSTPEAGFGANLTAAEKREQKARREAAAAASVRDSDEILQRAIKEARRAATSPTPVKVPHSTIASGMTVGAAIKMLKHDPDYLGDIPTERLEDLLTVTIDASVKKHHAKIRRELKTRKQAA